MQKLLGVWSLEGGCSRPPRCIWCGDFHLASVCPTKAPPFETSEPVSTCSPPPTCALCREAHPANFRGCKVRQEILRKKFPSEKTSRPTSERKITQVRASERSYSAALKKNQLISDDHDNIPSIPSVIKIDTSELKTKYETIIEGLAKTNAELIEKISKQADQITDLNKTVDSLRDWSERLEAWVKDTILNRI
ncbi:unnamed protein product [Bemisia tabaci]|uniref:Uncharacterized protein n=1 Tax=Bemisia tabaci TaxID=7038 RepID=A0A9P0A7S9_BEMTA|nr:unnamed protein product [Bemisia tabaci]